MADKTPHYKFYQNNSCEFFPCHSTENTEDFNCKFCFCPLYLLGTECGGNYTYLENGIKDCTFCLIPHQKNGYDVIISKLKLIKY